MEKIEEIFGIFTPKPRLSELINTNFLTKIKKNPGEIEKISQEISEKMKNDDPEVQNELQESFESLYNNEYSWVSSDDSYQRCMIDRHNNSEMREYYQITALRKMVLDRLKEF